MGDRTTIMDIAGVAGVSFKTVSRVLNGNPRVAADLRERVLKAAADLNYRPNLAARSLAGARHYAIAMLITSEAMANARSEGWYLPPFLMDLQARALIACQERGHRFHVEIIDEASPSLEMQLNGQRLHVDGVILAPPLADNIAVMAALEHNALPYVRISPGVELERAPAVMADEYGGALAMTQYLLSLGHRRIGFIHGPPQHLAATRRYIAFRDALDRCPGAEEISEVGDFTFAGGSAAGEKLLAMKDPPTAVFASNDDMAAGVIAAAVRCGIPVPEGLSVAGFDDSPFARLTAPPLTTVHQPVAGIVEAATNMLITGTMAIGESARQLQLPCKVIERGSTAPIVSEVLSA
jgi:LacI family transcriptional regulator